MGFFAQPLALVQTGGVTFWLLCASCCRPFRPRSAWRKPVVLLHDFAREPRVVSWTRVMSTHPPNPC
jgi:hypothetical protein